MGATGPHGSVAFLRHKIDRSRRKTSYFTFSTFGNFFPPSERLGLQRVSLFAQEVTRQCKMLEISRFLF
jgi:hypothetical protein